MAEYLDDGNSLESTTVAINRTATTVKGGRRMSFSALVVVGDRSGSVGVGYGKGRGVPAGIEKAQKDARKNLFKVKTHGGTLPHEVLGRSCASSVKLIPASPGTGVIAGGTVRAVLEMAGIRDCLTKAYGSTNKINLCRAAIDALEKLRTREEIAALRGVTIESSTVDEMMTAAKKFMTDSETAGGSKMAAPQNTVGKGKDGRRGGGGGGGRGRGGPGTGRGRTDAPAAATPSSTQSESNTPAADPAAALAEASPPAETTPPAEASPPADG